VHVQAPGVVALRDPAEFVAQPVVVGGVDDPLVEVVGPRVGAHRSQSEAHPLDQVEEPVAPVALPCYRVAEALCPSRPDLDLGGDQLAGRGIRQHLVSLTGGVDLLEAVLQLERYRIEDRELLLEADCEVHRALESLPGAVEVQ
jgi:hypothetical protein